MQTVVETPTYLADAEWLFSPDEQKAVVDRLAADPLCGVVIPGSGGIRKVRFGFGGRGKSGGARIIYLFGGEDLPVFALAAFADGCASMVTGGPPSVAIFVEAMSVFCEDVVQQQAIGHLAGPAGLHF